MMTTCQHCGSEIEFDSFTRKWVAGKKPATVYMKAKRGTWKCGNDPHFPVKSHSPRNVDRRKSEIEDALARPVEDGPEWDKRRSELEAELNCLGQ
jgi:hypothetical protein